MTDFKTADNKQKRVPQIRRALLFFSVRCWNSVFTSSYFFSFAFLANSKSDRGR